MNMALNVPPAIAKIAPDGNLTPRRKRQFLIQMALRRVKPGTGSAPEFMRERTAFQNWPNLTEILNGVNWVIIGGVATRAYMPERMTQDLDILIYTSDRETVLEQLEKAGYIIAFRSAERFSASSKEGIIVDVKCGDFPWMAKAFGHPKQDVAGLPVIALPYLVMLKLSSSFKHDLGDLTTMLGWASEEELEHVRKVIARFMPEEKDDLESLIFIGQHEQKDSPDWNQNKQ